MDAAPYIAQNRTFVPVRYLANALGVPNEKIGFENNMVALNAEKVVAKMFVGQKKIITNDTSKVIDVAPELKAGRTYLPARFVAEALGYQVGFVNGMVVCYTGDMPDVSAIAEYIGKPTTPKNPVETPDQEGVVDVGKVGQPAANFPWAKEEKLRGNGVKVTLANLKSSNVYKLGDSYKVLDMSVTPENIKVKQEVNRPIGLEVLLVDEDNTVRRRMTGSPKEGWCTYSVSDELEVELGNLKPADIKKVKYIVVYGWDFIEVENPLYEGGK
ncbi:copper amine oxidase domain protein [Desulforamulus reducens MI-1]|uniref:Copper amine oxidase domain protein n=1 Tax=Desulforamulus reducens (strain ATCC BAA-1160 / DSM 100696 / MI-1) TaxID=349161 RepID=A4J889_DESRM|nr:copper amine oxidase N-terminal domain-containing protein [Desulforamulus reducens]ABO51292.1 copper amine oxidase domain protein [Desulforamulus reducens MI-1]